MFNKWWCLSFPHHFSTKCSRLLHGLSLSALLLTLSEISALKPCLWLIPGKRESEAPGLTLRSGILIPLTTLPPTWAFFILVSLPALPFSMSPISLNAGNVAWWRLSAESLPQVLYLRREPPPPHLGHFPRGPSNDWLMWKVQRTGSLPQFRLTWKGCLSSRDLCGIGWACCCNFMTAQLLPLPKPASLIPSLMLSLESSATTHLPLILYFRISFLGKPGL